MLANHSHLTNKPIHIKEMRGRLHHAALTKRIFNPDNRQYDEENDTYICPNQQRLVYKYHSVRTDKTGFKREFKIYEFEDCSKCPFRSSCTKAKEGNNRKLMVNEKWEQQKEYVRAKLSEEKTSLIYRQRKFDVEPVFGFLRLICILLDFLYVENRKLKTKWASR